MLGIKKILISKEGKIFYVKDLSKDYHTQYGYITKASLKKNSGAVKTNTNLEFRIFTPSFIDAYKKIKRLPQIIPRKDIGLIISETGISKKSTVLDAGAGSGGLCCFLANICKQVITYEIREDFSNIVNENIKFLGLKNIKLRNKDITQGIDEKNIDLITIDIPNPWEAVKHTISALKTGGFLVSYSPTIPQVMDFIAEVKRHEELIHLKTVEITEREWEIDERKVRPKSQSIGHSGFISIVRKT